MELQKENQKLAKLEAEHSISMAEQKEKNKKDLLTIEESQKTMIAMIIQEKEKTVEAHQEAFARERLKMEVHHQAELESKQRQNQNLLDQ
jgi:hypothetical protein